MTAIMRTSLGFRLFQRAGRKSKDLLGGRESRFRAELDALVAGSQIAIIDLVGDSTTCGPKCEEQVILPWSKWIFGHFCGALPAKVFRPHLDQGLDNLLVPAMPLALIQIPKSYEDYLAKIGPKSRNMLRKAERKGYGCRIIDRNEHLQGIYEVNISKETRGGKPMTQAYREFPQLSSDANPSYCAKHQLVWYGCFLEQRLTAYCSMYFVNDLAVINTILGHGDHLLNGIMNALIAFVVQDCIENRAAKYINYLSLHSGRPELVGFKKRVGFDSYAVFVNVKPLKVVAGALPVRFAERWQERLVRGLGAVGRALTSGRATG
jgi:hypothetical protein